MAAQMITTANNTTNRMAISIIERVVEKAADLATGVGILAGSIIGAGDVEEAGRAGAVVAAEAGAAARAAGKRIIEKGVGARRVRTIESSQPTRKQGLEK